MAALCCASTSRRAIVCRRFDMRMRCSERAPAGAPDAAAGAAGAAAAPGAVRFAGGAAGALVRSAGAPEPAAGAAARSTSSFMTRPAGPLGWTDSILTPCSRATFLAVGVALTSLCADAPSGARLSGAVVDCAGGAALGAVPAPAFAGPASSTASTSPTLTSSPSRCLIAASTPSRSALTSRSIFSVSSSTSGSPTATGSPSFFNHFATRASTTDSPSSGTTIFVAIN